MSTRGARDKTSSGLRVTRDQKMPVTNKPSHAAEADTAAPADFAGNRNQARLFAPVYARVCMHVSVCACEENRGASGARIRLQSSVPCLGKVL